MRNILIISLVLLLLSCKKNEEMTDIQASFYDRTKATNIEENPLNIEVSSDLYMTIYARGKSSFGIKEVLVTVKVNGVQVKQSTISANSDKEFEVAQKLELDYSTNAGSVFVYEFKFVNTKNQSSSITANLNFLVNTFYSFRFLNFKDKDTMNAGDTLHLTPAYVSLTPNSKVKSMTIYRKIGFAEEDTVRTMSSNDFFFYQVGLITQYDYPIPASLPSGTGVMHRFEMINNQNARYVITHRLLVK